MRIHLSEKIKSDYDRAPINIQKAFNKCLVFLAQNLRHPSLHAKKYDESRGIWQARVTKGWRFYFTIDGNTYNLHDIKFHPK